MSRMVICTLSSVSMKIRPPLLFSEEQALWPSLHDAATECDLLADWETACLQSPHIQTNNIFCTVYIYYHTFTIIDTCLDKFDFKALILLSVKSGLQKRSSYCLLATGWEFDGWNQKLTLRHVHLACSCKASMTEVYNTMKIISMTYTSISVYILKLQSLIEFLKINERRQNRDKSKYFKNNELWRQRTTSSLFGER